MVTARPKTWVEVLVDCPGAQGLYTYELAAHLAVQPGDILSVPFGSQQLGAIAVRLLTQPPQLEADQIRQVDTLVSAAFFTPRYWQLLERLAHYYQTPLIQVIRTALPPGLLAKSKRRIRLVVDPPQSLFTQLPDSAQALLLRLKQSPNRDYSWQYLQRQSRSAYRDLRQLLQQGWVESYLATPQPPRPKEQQAVSVIAHPGSVESLTRRQQEILTVLQRQGGDCWLSEALQLCRTTSTTLKTLAAKGCLVIEPREVLRTTHSSRGDRDRPKALTPDQQTALDAINPLTSFAPVLLHGVTGSGKTEVYLQAIAPRLQAGYSVLVLVPEIGLTPQLTDRFQARFGDQVCVYHSALSDGERYDTWRQMLSGQPQVIIGTRSAIFAPLPKLGLIVLDEEHDSSFKQDQPMPCYHARTVARWRAELEGCPLVLGSATPSLESWVLVEGNRDAETQGGEGGDREVKPVEKNWQKADALPLPTPPPLPTPHSLYLPLPHRIHARPAPPIEVVDMRQELKAGNRSIFSRTLQRSLTEMREAGNQGILFIHRRGHSSFVSCRSCGYVIECPRCDVSLSYHQPHAQARPTLKCHYCGYGQAHPPSCPACESPYLKRFGSGTQRVVSELTKHLPDLRCIRFDSDTTRNKGSHRALLTRFAQKEADLLVGTQMLTKGIDLPQVTLVGVMAADGLLYMSDYWSAERAYQTITQVAGRAGRGDQPGRVIVQTYTPEQPTIETIQKQDYEAFAAVELEQRQALGYPPYGRLVLLRLSSLDAIAVQKTAEKVAIALEQDCLATLTKSADYEILGPAPAPILRVAQRYRWQILLKVALQVELPDITSLRQHCPNHVSFAVDVDVLNLF
ncbi:MAG: primosomal protein N' [Leptolyngbya sp. SIO4C5]|nr:primosomal protein N' [Leptolyngbya sp. SIO4C5]